MVWSTATSASMAWPACVVSTPAAAYASPLSATALLNNGGTHPAVRAGLRGRRAVAVHGGGGELPGPRPPPERNQRCRAEGGPVGDVGQQRAAALEHRDQT